MLLRNPVVTDDWLWGADPEATQRRGTSVGLVGILVLTNQHTKNKYARICTWRENVTHKTHSVAYGMGVRTLEQPCIPLSSTLWIPLQSLDSLQD